VLQPHQTYVCGNVLLSLYQQGAFKLLKQQSIEHDSATVTSMKFKLDDRGQNLDFLSLVMKDPATHLPIPIKEEKKETNLMLDAPVFNPKNAQSHSGATHQNVQPARNLQQPAPNY
jgi:hypothetical protein